MSDQAQSDSLASAGLPTSFGGSHPTPAPPKASTSSTSLPTSFDTQQRGRGRGRGRGRANGSVRGTGRGGGGDRGGPNKRGKFGSHNGGYQSNRNEDDSGKKDYFKQSWFDDPWKHLE